jgi:hypothetical protein
VNQLPEIALLTTDDGLAAVLHDLVNAVATPNRFSVEAAVSGLRHANFEVAIIDARVPGRMASVLARLFLYHNPTGRLAIVGGNPDSSTVLGMASTDSRVEVFFDPLDFEAIRQWTRAAVETAMTVPG